MVRTAGLEPALPYEKQILSLLAVASLAFTSRHEICL